MMRLMLYSPNRKNYKPSLHLHFLFPSELNVSGLSLSVGSLVLDLNLPTDGMGKDVLDSHNIHKTGI
jgi:hypothetical protein